MTSRILATWAEALRSFGIAMGAQGEALPQIGRPSVDSAQPDQFVPFSVANRLWQTLAEQYPERAIGLTFGKTVDLSLLGLVGHLARHCPTLGSSLDAVGRYHHLIDDQWSMAVDRTHAQATVTFSHDEHVLRVGHHMEAMVLGLVNGCRHLSENVLPIDEVGFQHAPKAPIVDYETAFGCPVRFEQRTTKIVFHQGILSRPNRMADAGLRQYLERRAKALLHSQPETMREDWVETVTHVIRACMREGQPTAQAVASNLHVSVRTFQRRLDEVDLSFASLLHEIRQAEAVELLTYSDLSISDIALRLGYEDDSGFFRAFKQWTRTTPEAYREQKRRERSVSIAREQGETTPATVGGRHLTTRKNR